MSLRSHLIRVPVLGYIIENRDSPIPGRTFFVLRDIRTRAFVSDPYRQNVDRRRHYCRNPRDAYRFVRRDLALRAGEDLGGSFDVVELPLHVPL